MPRPLIDLLWRDHQDAPTRSSRGPRARLSTGEVVGAAIGLADAEGLAAVTIRRLAHDLGLSAMSLYTHVNSRDDLVVLMADAVHGSMVRTPFGRLGWRRRVHAVAADNLELLVARPWLLDVEDERLSLGPGTIEKYDHELRAVAPLAIDPVTQDFALTHVLDFVRANARTRRPPPHSGELAKQWTELGAALAAYVGDDFPLARHVGAAVGEALGAASSPVAAWDFGLDRVLDGLAALDVRPRRR